jgi:hypothetical protein
MSKGKPTIAKLKALLEAIDLMSEDDDWTPTARQWKRIRDIIDALDEEPEPAPIVSHGPAPRPTTHAAPAGGHNPWRTGEAAALVPDVPSKIPADAPRTPNAAPGQSSLASVAGGGRSGVPSGNGQPPGDNPPAGPEL